ncbi:copper homeostasis protein CutC [Microbacterium sp. ARD32]|uniref:copper homeostasis protein CutC n=1 Tax=Microbacterium sp. ARD32 TaxID=2962577 RepID=UPI0028816D64|nr:copper homeostasis protein CutC [Microbacterium sp. ARD32]MDT0158188.1 copper homeostasis protein CutC [Microbacterium sp. ARD32]
MALVSLAFEIAVQNPAGMRIAAEVGAARVELAQALALGGLTPSRGMLESVLAAAGDDGPEVHVLIRPRAGGFRYGPDATEIMLRDVRDAVSAGAHGVVVGCQDATGALDDDALARIVDAAGAASVTLHRVIDVTPDPIAALRTARRLGLRRVLTSGGASRAVDGVDVLRRLVAEADGRIEIMAGGGIDAQTVARVAATGVDAVHFSAKRTVPADRAGEAVRLGSADDGGGGHEVTDRDTARAIIAALDGARTGAA